MTKPITAIVLALLLVTGSAWAEWVRVTGSETSDQYIDPATIRKDGNHVKVWEIQNLKQRHKDGELSRRARVEYDCKKERNRILSLSTFSGPMAGGTRLVDAGEVFKWEDIPPSSLFARVLKIVCAQPVLAGKS